MDWDSAFSFANGFALVAWAALILAPRGPKVHALIFYLGIGLLALAYSVGIVWLTAENGMADFGSLASVQALFKDDGITVIAWIHYLAFDLFVGQWIAKDADHKMVSRIVQAPILVLTLMAGPLGLFIWMLVRERRARAMAGIHQAR
ncbi:ABA4-like family protein [Sphingomicrobium clamense]|uniref:DUF4281 domain-containing protein n=1 Tax=Sphingomicrobium clamense TaxID=2851013 RepID=A0ABS6V5J4_9SPHN|nr:ABA4-like family protein [Sphingomicrobium sp. B8]MBW0144842.1 DUF4281 domain-containing protein [Sphingomicrobium sp. B8]